MSYRNRERRKERRLKRKFLRLIDAAFAEQIRATTTGYMWDYLFGSKRTDRVYDGGVCIQEPLSYQSTAGHNTASGTKEA